MEMMICFPALNTFQDTTLARCKNDDDCGGRKKPKVPFAVYLTRQTCQVKVVMKKFRDFFSTRRRFSPEIYYILNKHTSVAGLAARVSLLAKYPVIFDPAAARPAILAKNESFGFQPCKKAYHNLGESKYISLLLLH